MLYYYYFEDDAENSKNFKTLKMYELSTSRFDEEVAAIFLFLLNKDIFDFCSATICC
jgi:hypothetical protein